MYDTGLQELSEITRQSQNPKEESAQFSEPGINMNHFYVTLGHEERV